MKTKSKIFILTTALLVIFAVLVTVIWQFNGKNLHAQNITNRDNAKIWVLSDPHLIADSLHDDGTRFQMMEGTAASKDLKYQTVALKKLVQKAKDDQPNAIVLTGDITFNGEKKSAEEIAKIFAPLKNTKTKVLIIPGNHDIYDGWARKYSKNSDEKNEQISPEQWQTIFAQSYKNATSVDPDSLSYAVNLNNDYQLLMLDSNYYSGVESSAAPHTSGYLRSETLTWLKQQLKKGQKSGRKPIIFMHHNLYDHAGDNRSGYVLDNVDDLKKILKQFDVKLLFSGHIHIHDVMKDPKQKLPTIEVLNGSFAVSDKTYSEVEFSKNKITFTKKVFDLRKYLTGKEKKNKDLANYPKYLKDLFINETKALIIDKLYYKYQDDDRKLDLVANAFADVNYYYFTGQDNFTDEEVAQKLKTPGYQLLVENHIMSAQEIKNRLQDDNQNDNHFSISY